MGPDGQRINAPGTEAETSQAEGEDHIEEAGASNQLGQPSTIAKEKRKHRLVVYSDFDDSDAKLVIESDQGEETSTQKEPSESSEETQTDEEPPWVGIHIQTYEAHMSTGGGGGNLPHIVDSPHRCEDRLGAMLSRRLMAFL
ncbi:hypothetical protein L7F22_032926 [Adiantum nelumboides]|nr:hypothetical protein [Adiantum nelumboides]